MPDFKTNLLLGAGAIALTHTLTLWGSSLVPDAAAAPTILTATGDDEGGEGGEAGGEGGGGVPSSYALSSTDPNKWNYDATAVIDGYIAGAASQYAASAAEAVKLQAAVDALLASPSAETMAAARAAWVAARLGEGIGGTGSTEGGTEGGSAEPHPPRARRHPTRTPRSGSTSGSASPRRRCRTAARRGPGTTSAPSTRRPA